MDIVDLGDIIGYCRPGDIIGYCRPGDIKEILNGLEVNMQFCCPEEWEYYEGQKTAYSPKMDQSIFPLLYFV